MRGTPKAQQLRESIEKMELHETKKTSFQQRKQSPD
jgi:hypothetical protein